MWRSRFNFIGRSTRGLAKAVAAKKPGDEKVRSGEVLFGIEGHVLAQYFGHALR